MVLVIFLITLSILGYVLLFFLEVPETTYEISPSEPISDTYY